MISLRKAIEAQSDELFHRTLQVYKQTLGSIAAASGRAYPPDEHALGESLVQLQNALVEEAGLETIASTGERAGSELHQWGERAHRYYKEKTDEVKEVLLIIGDLANQMTDRDQRNAAGFTQLTRRLEGAAKLHDLSEIRKQVVSSVRELQSEVSRIDREGKDTVTKLRSQVAAYQSRLEEAERLASFDSLTGLFNRRAIEARLERHQLEGRPFSVILLDIDDFKTINDTLGHAAGDELLQQFAKELRDALRSSDDVGRWGGDEFLALVEGSFQDAEGSAKRIEDWVNGDYTLQGKPVVVHTSVGIAAWEAGEPASSVVERADAAMYARKPKRNAKSQSPAAR